MSADATLHYTDHGAGPALVLIAGLGGLGSFWDSLATELARSYRVLSFDHPGVGLSPAHEAAPTIGGIAAAVAGLLDRLGIERAHVIGHSTGGLVTQALALDYPHRVDRIVISGSWARPDRRFRDLFALRRAVLEQMGYRAYKSMSNLLAYPSAWYEAHIASQETLARDADGAGDPAVACFAQRIAMLLGFDRMEELARIGARTLVIGAKDDQVVPIHLSRQVAGAIPGASLVELEGGHFFPLLQPQHFITAVRTHLEET